MSKYKPRLAEINDFKERANLKFQEFIEKLKEGIKEETNQLWCIELIDKLAGDKLI